MSFSELRSTEGFRADAGGAYTKTLTFELEKEPIIAVFLPLTHPWCAIEKNIVSINGKIVNVEVTLDVLVTTTIATCTGRLLYY